MKTDNLKQTFFLNWDFKYINELKNIILDKLNIIGIEYESVIEILVTGSRVYRINNIKVFKKDSDLDIGIYLDDYIFYKNFINVDLLDTISANKVDFHRSQLKIYPFIRKFFFYNIKVSCFIFPISKGNFDGIFINRQFHNKWNLPYYSLLKNFYSFGNHYHLIDYVINLKRRLDKYMYCIICNEYKQSKTQLNIQVLTEEARLEDDEYTRNWKYCICEECYNILFKNGISDFITYLAKLKEEKQLCAP